jgi:hypothetical protein
MIGTNLGRIWDEQRDSGNNRSERHYILIIFDRQIIFNY